MLEQSRPHERSIVTEAAHHLTGILSRVPFIRLETTEIEPHSGTAEDLSVSLTKGLEPLRLVIEIRSHAQMRDAKLAAERLHVFCREQPGSYPVFCSQYLSPQIKDYCQENGISFFDFAGSYRFLFADVLIERDAPEARPLEKKRLRSFFSPKATRVLRRLLSEPHRTWKVMSLAKDAGVSPATVSLLKDRLIGDEYAREQADGFVLQRPARLLQAWSSQYQYKQNKILEFYARAEKPESDIPDDLENRFTEYCRQHNIDYAFTLFSGARRIAPFIRGLVQGGMVQSQVYVTDTKIASELAEALQMKHVDSGGNFLMLVADDPDLLFDKQEVAGDFVVSDIQLYLDLASHPTRGEENAEYLLEQRLQPKW